MKKNFWTKWFYNLWGSIPFAKNCIHIFLQWGYSKIMRWYFSMSMISVVALCFFPFIAVAGSSSFGDARSVDANAQIAIWWASWEIERDNALLDSITWAVNRVLWISGLITVIVLIYGGVQMVTSWWSDEQYNKWFAIIKAAAIWLLIIWFAWFVVSMWFWLAQQVWENAWPAWTEG